MTHLSVRLAWHDRGWDGRVCDAQHLNAHCIVHQHIRNSRDDDRERKAAGSPLMESWTVGCRLVHAIPLLMQTEASLLNIMTRWSSGNYRRSPRRFLRTQHAQSLIAGCARSSSKRSAKRRISRSDCRTSPKIKAGSSNRIASENFSSGFGRSWKLAGLSSSTTATTAIPSMRILGASLSVSAGSLK